MTRLMLNTNVLDNPITRSTIDQKATLDRASVIFVLPDGDGPLGHRIHHAEGST